MSLIGNLGNTAGKAFSGIGKMLTPPKKTKPPVTKNFLQESPEEYAQRLMARRSQRH
jgi:hypothetical protein